MRTIEVNLYKFNELSDEAKEKAREWWKKDGLDVHELEEITEYFQHKLKQLGLPEDDVNWSLSNCQGDGVAFYGDIDLDDYLAKNNLKEEYKELYDEDGISLIWNINIYDNNHHYHHYNTMSISYDNATDKEDVAEKLTDHILSHIKSLSKDFEKSGYKQIDHYNSNEYVDECIVANEYEFTEDGKIH